MILVPCFDSFFQCYTYTVIVTSAQNITITAWNIWDALKIHLKMTAGAEFSFSFPKWSEILHALHWFLVYY